MFEKGYTKYFSTVKYYYKPKQKKKNLYVRYWISMFFTDNRNYCYQSMYLLKIKSIHFIIKKTIF